MPIKLKKINNKWYTLDNRQYVGSAIQDRNIYWYGTDGSRTYLRRKGVYRPSPEIINYVKQTEAFSPTWYKDGNGYWTIGYGMKETPELRRKYPHSITKEQANVEFQNLANTYSQEMYQNTPNAQALNQNQLDALFSYYYNLGQTNYTQKSPAFQNALKSANWNEVINQMDFGYNDTKNPGLKKRRNYERQLFQTPMTVSKHYKGGQLIKHNINVYKQGGNMKVKDNNQTTLIPRHQTGGLASNIAEKFRKAKYVMPNAAEKFRQVKVGRFQGDSPESAILLPEIIITPQATNSTKSASGTRSSSTRGNARTTAKPVATTFTESPTNITDQGWLDARNAAMQRGWGTYNYNGQTYRFKGDEFQQAKRNWNNRRKVGYQAEGILDLNPPAEITTMIPRGDGEVKPEDAIIEKNTPIDTKTTPYTFWYQQQLTNNPNLTRDMLWQATQDVRNGKRDASYYGESSDLVSQLANANQDSAKNYIYNLWNTNNDVATQAGRKNYTENQGLTFGEGTTNNAAFQSINTNQPSMYYTGPSSWLTDNSWKKKIDDIYTRYKQNTQSARQGTKLIRRK